MSELISSRQVRGDLSQYRGKALFLSDWTPVGYRLEIKHQGGLHQLMYLREIPGLRLPPQGKCFVTDAEVLFDGRPHGKLLIFLQVDPGLAVYDTREHRADLRWPDRRLSQ